MTDKTFAHYYQTELAYLRDLAQEFSRSYPEVAHIVSERGGDQAVERLYQGAALLTARLRFRIEDDIPEIIHVLCDQLWPQLLRPTPAVSLIQFTPIPNALRMSRLIPRGTSMLSRPGTKQEFVFRTTADVDLHPIELEAVELKRAHPADIELRLSFSATGGASLDHAGMRSISLQLVGDAATKYTLYMWLVHHATGVSIRDPDGQSVLELTRAQIRPKGFGDDEPLYPFLPTPLPGLRLVQELIACPDKFLGVQVSGLDQIPRGSLAERFQLAFHLGPLPDPDLPLGLDNLRLSCAPVINISEPLQVEINVEQGRCLYQVQVPGGWPVFEIDRVGGYHHKTGEWLDYQQLFSGSAQQRGAPCYHIVRRAEGVQGVQTHLRFTTAAGRPQQPPADTVSVWLTHTNGDLPTLLEPGQIDTHGASSPEYATFANLTPVLQGGGFELNRDRHWKLLALFSMHPRDLLSQAGLQLVLDAVGGGREPRILGVQCELTSRLHRQTLIPARAIRVDLDQQAFGCAGEAYLFGRVVSCLLASPPESLVRHEVSVCAWPDGAVYTFAGQGVSR